MNSNHSALRALLVAAATLLATGAWAQSPNAAPQAKANAADKAEKKAEKAADKAEKAADKTADKDKDSAEKAKSADERTARKAKEHTAQREKLAALLKVPVSEALRQELRRHAERLARLERIKVVAEAEKDKDSAEKATKLIAKENERHEKWMGKLSTAAEVKDAKKEGAK